MADNKVGRDVAEQEFDRFVDLMDLDLDPSNMDEDDRKGLEDQKGKLLDAIQRGSLVINEQGEPVYTTQRSETPITLTFKEPTGAALMAMDRRKKNEDVAKMYATMAEITGTDAKTFATMKMADLKVCTAVVTLFLG